MIIVTSCLCFLHAVFFACISVFHFESFTTSAVLLPISPFQISRMFNVVTFLFIVTCFFVYRNSKKINSTVSDTTITATTSSISMTTSSSFLPAPHLNKSPRKSWSSIAYNNKNFPDGKLVYDQQQATVAVPTTATGKLFNKGFTKFERSGQDVMARASQIVQ